jgi:hypothetical protein
MARSSSDCPQSAGCGAAVIEQVLRDVGEDHPPGRPEPFQRAERDESVAGAHVQQRLAGREPGPVQHLLGPANCLPSSPEELYQTAAGSA